MTLSILDNVLGSNDPMTLNVTPNNLPYKTDRLFCLSVYVVRVKGHYLRDLTPDPNSLEVENDY